MGLVYHQIGSGFNASCVIILTTHVTAQRTINWHILNILNVVKSAENYTITLNDNSLLT